MFVKRIVLSSVWLLFTPTIFANSSSDNAVNILTWWGYLDKPWISKYVNQQCGVPISFDEYSSNAEFLRRFREVNTKYDVVIFADAIFNLVKSEIASKGTDLSYLTTNYNRYIKNNYAKMNYPKNVAYFSHSVTGVLWNPDVIKINPNDGLDNIFNKAKSNLVVMIDDPVEARLIMGDFTENNFIKMIRSSRVFITNDFNRFDNKNDLAFSYLWSGEAFLHVSKFKNKYKFSVNPEYSYFSSDLVASLNKNSQTTCVARVLSSKDFLDKLQADTFYISPYADVRSIKNSAVRLFYANIIKNIEMIRWIKPLSKDEFYKSNQTWNYIKLRMYEKNKNE